MKRVRSVASIAVLSVLVVVALLVGNTVIAATTTTVFGPPANGVNDSFATPPEPASPSVAILAWLASIPVGNVDFDPIPTDQYFAHTITGLPPCIVGATLEIRMHAGTSSLTVTDSLLLEFTGTTTSPSFEWGQTLNSLINLATSGAQPTWTPGSDFTFILNLDALPPDGGGDTSVISSMESTGTLDVVIQDDTGVDYMILKVRSDCGDHYLGYQIRELEKTQTIFLRDQFVKGPFVLGEPDRLYTPADKRLLPEKANLANVHDPETHLKRYQIEGLQAVTENGVQVANQFGTFVGRVQGPTHLLVPTTKSLSQAKLPGQPRGVVDHFLCYRFQQKGKVKQGVSIADQFGLAKYKVSGAIALCNPVEKTIVGDDGTTSITPIMNPALHLMCFRVKGGKPPKQQVNTNNQFGRERLLVQKQRELCLPSSKSLRPDPPPPPPPTGPASITFGAPDNGVNDSFAAPTEPTSPSAAILAWLASIPVGNVAFDPTPTDQYFAHTITGLPSCIVGATLEIRMRAGPSGLTTTDSLLLEFTGTTTTPSFEWGQTLNSLINLATSGAQPTWTPGSDFTFVLNLDALPPDGGGDTSVIKSMNATGTLDVVIQDDTGVDYMVLNVRSNCDHYLGYKVKPLEDTLTVALRDQFMKGNFQVGEPDRLFTPADKQILPDKATTKNIRDPRTHLKRYRIDGPQVKVKGITVRNQFGTFVINVKGPDSLLVPTTKTHLDVKLPVPPTDKVKDPYKVKVPDKRDDKVKFRVDHFLCYKTEAAFQAGVSVADQFGIANFKVSDATRFCNPVEKRVLKPDGTVSITRIKNPETHLMCFEVEGGTPPNATVDTDNQFGSETLIVREAKELCVPSRKRLNSDQGPGVKVGVKAPRTK